MGHTPIPRYMPSRPPSRFESTKSAYVAGRISLERFEELVEVMLRDGLEDEPWPVQAPPKPSDVAVPLPADSRLVYYPSNPSNRSKG